MSQFRIYDENDVPESQIDAIISGYEKPLAGLSAVIKSDVDSLLKRLRKKIALTIAEQMNNQLECIIIDFLAATGNMRDCAIRLSSTDRAAVLHDVVHYYKLRFKFDPVGILESAVASRLDNAN